MVSTRPQGISYRRSTEIPSAARREMPAPIAPLMTETTPPAAADFGGPRDLEPEPFIFSAIP